jgi:hypothetical protein
MQDVDKTVVRARNWFETRHALKFALESALTFERCAVNELHRAPRSGKAASQPDFAVSAPADHAQNFMIRNKRDLPRSRMLRRACFHFVSDAAILHKRG